ncbi:hypothetical protein F4604DRAFT_1939105 [Suillus subluteus]|nr:hypothetical protein F4604DRAFT_1939105 [Suillus subluteus]
MATETSEPKAQWNARETDLLLAVLLSKVSEAGNGNGFKPTTFNAVATALDQADLLTAGPPKTAKCCKTKLLLLKQMYGHIETYHGLSGVHWDNERGAGIEGEAAWAQARNSMRQYHNTGWPFYSQVQAILPNGRGAQGHHAFHAALATAAPLVNNPPDTEQDENPPLTVAGITLHDILMQDSNPSIIVSSSTTVGSANISFVVPHLPGPPSTAVGSSLGKGKRARDDELLETETVSYISSSQSYSSPIASSTLISAPSAKKT